MEILVAYDVATDTSEGRRRLRKVAKICEGHGQRVQKSVFEWVVNGAQMERFRHRLLAAMEPTEDSLRIYRLREPHDQYLEVFGRRPDFDLRDPLVV